MCFTTWLSNRTHSGFEFVIFLNFENDNVQFALSNPVVSECFRKLSDLNPQSLIQQCF